MMSELQSDAYGVTLTWVRALAGRAFDRQPNQAQTMMSKISFGPPRSIARCHCCAVARSTSITFYGQARSTSPKLAQTWTRYGHGLAGLPMLMTSSDNACRRVGKFKSGSMTRQCGWRSYITRSTASSVKMRTHASECPIRSRYTWASILSLGERGSQ